MLSLISHIIRTSARRDRTEINSTMVDTLVDLFQPLDLSIHRCYKGGRGAIVYNCAGADREGLYCRNAYLPDRRHCRPIAQQPLLQRCHENKTTVMDMALDGSRQLVFPVLSEEQPLYFIETRLPGDFPPEQHTMLLGITEYFANHIALLDYGETDSLTTLSNRKTFDKHLFEILGATCADEEATPLDQDSPLRRHARAGAGHWLAVCDIDHFKAINDTHGHLIGDEVLVILAQLMKESFRFDDPLFRFGGEEFVVVLQPTDADNALRVLERFRSTVAAHPFSRVGQVTASIGFTRIRPNDTPADAIDRADEALYYAKRHGRNQVCRHEDLVAAGRVGADVVEKGEIELF